MSTRRNFLLGAGTSLLAPPSAGAIESCGLNLKLGVVCTTSVDLRAAAAKHFQDVQQQKFWCWAASISNIFAYHGHPVSQSRIVSEVYGDATNEAAFGSTISEELDRKWIDDHGRSFRSTLTGLFDLRTGTAKINKYTVHRHLASNNPLIIGSAGHAMLMTGLRYTRDPRGPDVFEALVFDPWPGKGMRTLSRRQITPPPGGTLVYLASVRIS
jgi:hypothetical protein